MCPIRKEEKDFAFVIQGLRIGRRFASGWGMSGLWDKLRGGFGRTDAAISRIRQARAEAEAKSKTKHETTSSELAAASTADPITKGPEISKEPEQPIDPWNLSPTVKPHIPPTQLWMQSPYVRGSTQKMTDLSRQIIGLPLDAALLQMRFCPKKKAATVMQVLSAIKSTIMRSGGNAAYYYIKSATVGRGTYLKRLDIKGRGRFGVQWRGHAFIRICCHKPDPKALAHKLLKIKKIPREDKPIMKSLDYC